MSAATPTVPHGATDVHVHVTVESLLAGPGGSERWRPTVARDHDGRQVSVELGGRPMRSIVRELSRLEVVLEGSRSRGVGRLVVSPWVSTLPLTMEPAAAADVCRVQNEALARAVAAHPGEIQAFGSVPMVDAELAAEVLGEAVALGLVGAEVTPSAAGMWLGDPKLEPFFAAADSLGATVFVHPGTHGLGIDVFDEYYLWNAVANPVETAIAGAHLVMAGTFERHPGLRVLLAHGGGALPGVVGRLERAHAVRPESRARLARSPRWSFGQLHFDTVTHDRALLASLVAAVGASHVLLGSDYPFDMGSDDPVGDVTALGLAPADEEAILRGNAAELFAPRTGQGSSA